MTVAVYLRISKEDKESNSIESQRGMVLHAIEHMPEYADAHIAEFCDDGFSGRNFRRPGVERLLRQVQEGGIQCIIVKDLSRFGRNYLEAGSYIFRVFPALGVRFIALNDGFDSQREMEENSLEVSFRTLLYDIYSRDLSDKVKSALYGKARRGEYVCALAPYGYRKDSTDKHRIVPDADAAAQVRRIFRMAASGQSTRQIARTMNEEQILTPLQYRRANGCGRTVWNCIGEENFWTQQTVAKILRDERYTGKAVYGRQKRENAGVCTGAGKAASWQRARQQPKKRTSAAWKGAVRHLRARNDPCRQKVQIFYLPYAPRGAFLCLPGSAAVRRRFGSDSARRHFQARAKRG